MTRQKMVRRVDKAVFRRTARSTCKANLIGSSFRGGIRL